MRYTATLEDIMERLWIFLGGIAIVFICAGVAELKARKAVRDAAKKNATLLNH